MVITMKGYRTIVLNFLALIFSLAAGYGFEISAEDQGAVSTGVLALINIILRFYTDTRVFSGEGSKDKNVNRQAGFVNIKMLVFISILSVITLPGCALINSMKGQPIVDCVSLTVPTNNSIGACYSTIKSLAETVDSLADSGLITKDREDEYLDELQSALDILKTVEAMIGNDMDNATDQLRLAQKLLVVLSDNIEDRG